MSEPDGTKLYPSWRQLEADLLASGMLVDGSVIPMDYLRAGIGVSDPRDLSDGLEVLRQQAQFNFAMGAMLASLLENHRIKLRVVDGVGYMVVPPDEQTRVSMKDGGNEIACAIERAIRGVRYVRLEQLSEDQRKENSDALAKLGAMQSLARKRLR